MTVNDEVTRLIAFFKRVADHNAGLNTDVLKGGLEVAEVVFALWKDPGGPHGCGLLVAKGERVLDNFSEEAERYKTLKHKRGGLHVPICMEAVWCNTREEAEAMCQAYNAPRQ